MPNKQHSKAKQNAAVGEAVDRPDLHDDMRKIFEASLVIHKSIEQAKKDPWVFNGSLENSSEDVVPHKLHSMILWILKGMYTVKAEARAHELNQSATVISQQILQAHKSNRQILYEPKSPTAAFRSTMETPITLGISLYCDHKWRIHKLASLLSLSGVPKSKTVYNSNSQRCTGEHREAQWELCTTRTSQAAKTLFLTR